MQPEYSDFYEDEDNELLLRVDGFGVGDQMFWIQTGLYSIPLTLSQMVSLTYLASEAFDDIEDGDRNG